MGNLLVLNLHLTKISKLPSLKGLTKLKAFYLNRCSELKIGLNEIQPLKNLEVFDIRDTKVNFMPCLKSLRCLRMSFIESDKYYLIAIVQKLEELTIEVKSLQNAHDIVDAVASLKKLTTLRCTFYSSEIREEFLRASESWIPEKTRSSPFAVLYDMKTQNI
ncbi:hypothetical protein K1719_004106 [Acacia pycnantha]|nr:hypothetical protein K1719_004106 [Acacia pycnantha]